MKNAAAIDMDLRDTVSMCSLRAGAGLFGIETTQIREVLGSTSPQRVPLAPEHIAGVVPHRGEILTTVDFRVLLGLERRTGPGCVLVLDEEESRECFGLLVDGVGGVVTLARGALEANPSALDARSMALFDGVFRMPAGLMVHLDPQRLRPSRLAESGMFAAARRRSYGGQR
jgi:purine-binding chemotaxis protein CheW